MTPGAQPDPQPEGISVPEAYAAIREWYQRNIFKIEARADDYAIKSARLIRALPESDSISLNEQQAILWEVRVGYLEWGYHEFLGRYKLSSIARAAVEAHGKPHGLNQQETEDLRNGKLWPFLSPQIIRSGREPDRVEP
jgi:hypothetical protein